MKMFICTGSGQIYTGDMVPGDREATDQEVLDWTALRTDKPRFSSRDFLKRFTPEEKLAVVTATMSSAHVKLLWDNLLAADHIDLADPEVEEGIDYLIAQELIDADRKAEVLA